MVYGTPLILLNFLYISTSGMKLEVSSTPVPRANNGSFYSFPEILPNMSRNATQAIESEEEEPLIFLLRRSNHGSQNQEITTISGLNSTPSVATPSHEVKRGVLDTFFGISSNSSTSTETASTSTPASAFSITGRSETTALPQIYRKERSAHSSHGGHRYASQGYPRPQYHHSGCVYETTTTTTPSPPQKVLICIVDGKVVELEDTWKSCPTTTTTTTVGPKHDFEHKPLELQTLKPLEDPLKLANLLHH